jgi:hypothetical protein
VTQAVKIPFVYSVPASRDICGNFSTLHQLDVVVVAPAVVAPAVVVVVFFIRCASAKFVFDSKTKFLSRENRQRQSGKRPERSTLEGREFFL